MNIKKIGVFQGNRLIESFDDLKEALQKSLQLSEESGLPHTFRPVRFTDLTDAEKLLIMSHKLKDLQSFLLLMKGSGRSYQSHIRVDVDELEWLVQMATENLKNETNS